MPECYGKKFVINGDIQPTESFDNSLIYEGDSIYEVIRLVKGVPVFFSDHIERLTASVMYQKKKILADPVAIRKAILLLTRSDKKKEANIKIVFNYDKGSDNYLIYLIEPIYPTIEQYTKGVRGILYVAERKDPESKIIHHILRSSIYHKLIHEGAYEALLVNDKNLITEGSRSNIFFMKDDTLYTAPDNIILNGITRKYILEICRERDIPVKFKCVNADKMSEYEAAFMTGTSPMVLPFNTINDALFNVREPLIEKLRKLYLLKVNESIRQFRSE
jgi:branched-chain amino acid aminotransferase